jgi:hypothetical protein
MFSCGGHVKNRVYVNRWLGHTLRKKDEEIPKKALKWNPEGRRKPGRPKETWITTTQSEVKKSFSQMGYTYL